MGGKVDAMLAERGRRSDQRVGALDGKLGGKPCAPQHPRLGPYRRRKIVLGTQVLSQRGEQRIPALVSDRLGLNLHETPSTSSCRIGGLRRAVCDFRVDVHSRWSSADWTNVNCARSRCDRRYCGESAA